MNDKNIWKLLATYDDLLSCLVPLLKGYILTINDLVRMS